MVFSTKFRSIFPLIWAESSASFASESLRVYVTEPSWSSSEELMVPSKPKIPSVSTLSVKMLAVFKLRLPDSWLIMIVGVFEFDLETNPNPSSSLGMIF